MHVVVNAAVSADGKLSNAERETVALSSSEDFDRVHSLRSRTDAVAVGVGTVLADDPALTVRRVEGENPVRVVADSRARTPDDAAVLDAAASTVVGVGSDAPDERLDALRAFDGVEVVETPTPRTDLGALFDALEERGVETVMVEGGGEVVASVLAGGHADEVLVYTAPVFVGGRDAPTLVDGDGFDAPVEATLEEVERVGDGVLLRYVTEGR